MLPATEFITFVLSAIKNLKIKTYETVILHVDLHEPSVYLSP